MSTIGVLKNTTSRIVLVFPLRQQTAILTVMESTHRRSRRSAIFITVFIIALCAFLGLLAWRYALHPKAAVVLPNSVSSKLLFTPYLPKKLPDQLTYDTNSATTREGALFFSAENDTVTITFSEQTVPKDYDLNTFYDANISSPSRLKVHKGIAVYGETYDKKGNIFSYITPNNTWIIASSVGPISKSLATDLINSLEAQQ